MWDALSEICVREGRSVHEICGQIDNERRQSGLTAAVRVFILNYFREAATEEGHALASQRRNNSGTSSLASSNDSNLGDSDV